MKIKNWIPIFFLFALCIIFLPNEVSAQTTDPLNGLVNVNIGDGKLTDSLKILVVVTILGLAPSIFIMFTCFTQISIMLGLTRQALGTNNIPSNQILVGLAIFLTIYTMSPVFSEINKVAYKPYDEGKISFEQAVKKAEKPMKSFMLKNTYDADIKTMLKIKKEEKPKKPEDVSFWAATPAFILSQITKGLTSGLMIYAAFIILDFIIGSVLMFMGMMMLPPQVMSIPIKLLIFLYVGGFGKIIEIFFKSVVT